MTNTFEIGYIQRWGLSNTQEISHVDTKLRMPCRKLPLINLGFINGKGGIREVVHGSQLPKQARRVIQTDKLVRSFGIVAISLSFISILLVLSRNVVPVKEDVINLGNWKFSALIVVAPKTKLSDHLPAILSNRTSNSSSSCRGWLVKQCFHRNSEECYIRAK